MDEGTSKKGGLIKITDDDSMPFTFSSETHPLMVLFERDTKSSTVLTDVQILLILEKEFDMDIKTLHKLEIEIYIGIIKTFSKDWPQWDTLDPIINKLKKKKSFSQLRRIIKLNYRKLKKYLWALIEIAKPTTADLVNKLKTLTIKQTDPLALEINDDILLEVSSTRRQFNSFIFNTPNSAENNYDFNLIDFEPYQLTTAAPSYTFSSILHWYGVRLSITLPFFQLSRDTVHILTRKLVNDLNDIQINPKKVLNSNVYMKTKNTISKSVMVDRITVLLNKILEHYSNKPEYDMLKQIFNDIKYDMKIYSNTIEVPGSYKHYLSKYPYVRKIFANVDLDEPSSHNLYTEETVTPIQNWRVGKFLNEKKPKLPNLRSWLKFECLECDQKFKGVEFLTNLLEHFKTYHVDEPDWTCTNCEKVFSMAELTDQGWWHDC